MSTEMNIDAAQKILNECPAEDYYLSVELDKVNGLLYLRDLAVREEITDDTLDQLRERIQDWIDMIKQDRVEDAARDVWNDAALEELEEDLRLRELDEEEG